MIIKISLVIILVFLLALLVRGIYETFILDVSFSVLGNGAKSLRVLLLSDLHAGYLFVSKEKIRKAILNSGAEVILFAGDMTNSERDQDKAKVILKLISDAGAKIKAPVFAVLGNHDLYPLNNYLKEINISLLLNESQPINAFDGSKWLISGLEDLKSGRSSYIDSINEFIKDNSDSLINFDGQVVLAHNPDTFFSLREIDSVSNSKLYKTPMFFLTGHFHGGQIWMPFDLEYRLLRKELMAKQGCRRGAFIRDGIQGYITRGMGCVLVPIRLFSIPEISILELRV